MLSIHIQTSEVLRYLRVTGQPDKALQARVDQACEAVCQAAVPRYTCRYFPLERRPEGLCPRGSGLVLAGQAIAKHLEGCDGCYLMAATLGAGVDRLIARSQASDMAFALMLDAAASDGIEYVCDYAEAELSFAERQKGGFLTGRFSPGYGDLSITIQKDFLFAVDAPRKIGLTVSAGGILLPQKSVTAILGRADRPVGGVKKGCGSCSLREDCQYRKDGLRCGR